MSVRQREIMSLAKNLLGPKNGLLENMEKDPRNEYITGILEPRSYDRGSIENYGNADISAFTPDEEHEDDNTDAADDFEILPSNLDPRALPKSMGLSFVVQAEKPLIDLCVTWARYFKNGKWIRKPERFIMHNVNVTSDSKWRPSTGVRVVLRSVQLGEKAWHISIYVVNDTKVEDYVRTHDLIFQPQIRVHFQGGVTALPVDKRLEGNEEAQLALLYRELQGLARGHLCGATWKDIDPERPSGLDQSESPFLPEDVKNLPEGEKALFTNPDVRSEFLPSYTVYQTTIEVGDIPGMEKDDTDASVLAEKWDYPSLSSSLGKIGKAYGTWMEKQTELAGHLPDGDKEIAERSLQSSKEALTRIEEGINLLNIPAVRLAFCFMNKAMNKQSIWARKGTLIWRPFQLAFILQCMPSIAQGTHQDRKTCDLLWYPTGGGKTEAYLGLAVFTLALRRLGYLRDESSQTGTAVISRYTLRLLTIQQFRRALSVITACEYLRTMNWRPEGFSSSDNTIWGTSRFSIGLWIGGNITPNLLVDHTGWDSKRNISTRFVGAVGILKYSHRHSSRPGERLSYQGEEPAQVLRCPCCSSILAIPSVGFSGREHELYWIMSAEAKPEVKATDLDYGSFRVREVRFDTLPNRNFFVGYVRFTTTSDKLKDELVRDWWKQRVEKVCRAKLASSAASRPGYFIRHASGVYHKPVDFEIHCPNPGCELNSLEWIEMVPGPGGKNHPLVPLEPFKIPSKNEFKGVLIPAYTVDAQVYARCPSMVIATVDKFARLPFEEKASAIFGNVNRYDDVWGYHRDIVPPDTGGARVGHVVPVSGFHPPELIIQDELHLIDGPLGSMVGLYETAVDILASTIKEGSTIPPKYIASTATTREAATQTRSLYNRMLRQFPPSGISASDSFFSGAYEGHPLDTTRPGRLYVGVCSPGKGPQTPTIRIWASLLQEAERIRREGNGRVEGELDYFWTVVGYFNAIRELAQARSLYRQDIPEWIKRMDGEQNARAIEDYNMLELHGNIDSADIPAVLDQLERVESGVDAVMATSMFGTGVDIDRLSLMVVHGQPKTTSSYIQATGRVGRKKGGLVVTFLRSTRPRDLDHYEFFTGYHRAMHRYVEPITVAPFSPRACDRALGPVAVAIMRNGNFVRGVRISPDWAVESEYWKGTRGSSGARLMAQNKAAPELQAIEDAIEDRANDQPKNRKRPPGSIKKSLESGLDKWENIARIEPGLFYYEPTYQRQPSNPVVLGDPQHVQGKKRVVFEKTPQSMRELESSTRFEG